MTAFIQADGSGMPCKWQNLMAHGYSDTMTGGLAGGATADHLPLLAEECIFQNMLLVS